MGIKDRVVRWAIIRWASGKLSKWKDGGGAMWNFMNGRKGMWISIGVIISSVVFLMTGVDVSQWLELALKSAGMSDPAMIEEAKKLATAWAPLIAAAIAATHTWYKNRKQRKAGATFAEAGSLVGQAKLAIAEGVVRTLTPNALVVDGQAVDAKEAR
jgi:hypothetical protein